MRDAEAQSQGRLAATVAAMAREREAPLSAAQQAHVDFMKAVLNPRSHAHGLPEFPQLPSNTAAPLLGSSVADAGGAAASLQQQQQQRPPAGTMASHNDESMGMDA